MVSKQCFQNKNKTLMTKPDLPVFSRIQLVFVETYLRSKNYLLIGTYNLLTIILHAHFCNDLRESK